MFVKNFVASIISMPVSDLALHFLPGWWLWPRAPSKVSAPHGLPGGYGASAAPFIRAPPRLAARRRAGMIGLQDERRCDADSGELVELDSCDKTPVYAKVQRMRGGIAEIVRKVFAAGGMPLVLAAACAGALREKL